MKLPQRLSDLLARDTTISSFTFYALGRIESQVAPSRLEFFPEYTDHGLKHIEETLQTAYDLATEQARALLTPADAAVLSVAVGLHDLGMHLTRDGFESLIAPGSRWVPMHPFDDRPWSELWENFFAEARRFDGRKLRSLFGENYLPPRTLPKAGENWNDFDRLLVGEFIRRHHHRLAHEISVYGFPGKDGHAVQICLSGNSNELFWADMSGLVARSHGMLLRPCVDYLYSRYDNKVDPKRVHGPFLMTLIRLADYFQIQPSRAPEERTDVETFHSGISSGEWKVHQCISDINNTSADPDAIVVNAKPKDLQTFLRVRRWLDGIQNELDSSWAVIGEVYGRQTHESLDRLELRLRRVRSNIDRIEEFSKTVNYVPQRIVFDTASSDLLNLLVGPLYSNKRSVGLRELIQNAIDAVRELEDLRRRRAELNEFDMYNQEADVVVEFNCSDQNNLNSITITDRGSGMTSDVISEFFLKAGASFRRSEAWKHNHQDASGHSRVLRTGRFGVGVLAAFLLGDEIEVTTRHYSARQEDALTFKARVDSQAISLERTSAPVGTRIFIHIPESKRKPLASLVPADRAENISFESDYGVYFLRSPSLLMKFSHLKRNLEVQHFLPGPQDLPSETWRWFDTEEFGRVFWSYDRTFPYLSCNGIPVVPRFPYNQDYVGSSAFKRPNLSVFDRDGLLPINLQRTGMESKALPFEELLLKSIVMDIVAYAITSDISRCEGSWLQGKHPAFVRDSYGLYSRDLALWSLCKSGFFLTSPSIIRNIRPKSIVLVMGGKESYDEWGDVLRKAIRDDTIIVSYQAGDRINVKGALLTVGDGFTLPKLLKEFAFSAVRTWVSETYLKNVHRLQPGRKLRGVISRLKADEDVPSLSVHSYGKSVRNKKLAEAIDQVYGRSDSLMLISELAVRDVREKSEIYTVAKAWSEVAGTYVMPFSRSERKKLESDCVMNIQNYVDANKVESRKRAEAKKEAEKNENLDELEAG